MHIQSVAISFASFETFVDDAKKQTHGNTFCQKSSPAFFSINVNTEFYSRQTWAGIDFYNVDLPTFIDSPTRLRIQ